jgi:hypothetical protein
MIPRAMSKNLMSNLPENKINNVRIPDPETKDVFDSVVNFELNGMSSIFRFFETAV